MILRKNARLDLGKSNSGEYLMGAREKMRFFKVSKCIFSPHYSHGKFVTNRRAGNKVNLHCVSGSFNVVSGS